MTEQRPQRRHTVVGALRAPGVSRDQAHKREAATTGSIAPDTSPSLATAATVTPTQPDSRKARTRRTVPATPVTAPDAQVATTQRNHDHNPWITGGAIAGGAVAITLAILLRGGGSGVNVSSASASPDNSGHPTDSLKPSASSGATAKLSETPSNLPFDLKTLTSEMAKIHAGNYALTIDNWTIIYDHTNPGAVMEVDPSGQAHLVSTLNTQELSTVGQGYTDGIVPGKDQAISWVLAPGTYMPLRGITEWPVLAGQTPESATEIAFQGQAALEANTQPKVCILKGTESLQAVPENTQDLSNAPKWQPDTSMTADEVAAKYGVSGLATDGSKWHKSADGGWTLDVDQTGASSIVSLHDAVGQAYVDDQNPDSNGHQVAAVTFGVGTEAPVRGITIYIGVPKGMEQEVLDYAFKQHVNKELGLFNPNDAQIGVYVVKVPETICPIERQASPTSAPTQAEIKAKATAAATEIANTPWYKQFVDKLPANTTSLLSDGGLKIKESTPKTITVPAGYEAIYWNGSKTVKIDGPITITTAEGTIYKTK